MEEPKLDTTKQKKTINKRVIIVLIFLLIYVIASFISYRGEYLEMLEMGQDYLTVFHQNKKYQYITAFSIFLIVFISIYITNKFIKKGLKEFFKEENKPMPKLPNKSLAFIISIVISILFTNAISEKLLLCVNATWFGIPDSIFGADIGFYMFQKTFIETIINYFIYLIIGLAIYTVAYYIITFNKCFDAISRETLKKNTFIKQLIFFVRLIVVAFAASILIKMQGIGIGEFLKLKDIDSTAIYGAGLTDISIKLWGYRILAIVIVVAVFVAIRFFKKGQSSKVIFSLCMVPSYLVILFIVMTGFQLIYVNSNELDKQRDYITNNIKATKQAYNINIEEIDVNSTGTITTEQAEQNKEVLKNITIANSDITLSTLSALQTSTGYYAFSKTIPTKYTISNEKNLVYVSAREILSKDRTYSNKTYEYTHGYGTIVSSATSTDENGNINFIQKEFDGSDMEIKVRQPRIYFGLQTNDVIVTNSSNKKEFDYPKNATESVENSYDGNAGLKLNFFDRLALAIKEKDIKLAFSTNITDESKILINRNIINRAKKIMPYLIYDEEPYLVITDSGELVWVLDAYTISNQYPYSQQTTIEYGNSKKQINYIRNSAKILVDAYDGTINFYITDKSDPIIMAYDKIYDKLFKDENEIPDDIAEHFVYPKYLYNVQAKILEMYHNVSTDVLYRGDDIWEIATDFSSSKSTMQPYYTMVKTIDSSENELGLVLPYTPQDKKNINAYLVGTTDGTKKVLKLYKFSSDSNILGTAQLSSQIEENERISKEISSITVTGTKLIKDIIIVPIDGTLLYVEPIYQVSLNEKNSVPVLKKVIIASGNKLAIGDTLNEALDNLLSEHASRVEVEDTDTIEGLIDTIIKANNNLTESNKSNNWEQIGKDLSKLQELINVLEKLKDNKQQNNVTNTEEIQNNIIINNQNLILEE